MAAKTGRTAYDGYKYRARGVSLVSGVELPEWDDLPDEIKDAWQAAADAVQEHIEAKDTEGQIDGETPGDELHFDEAHGKG